LVNEDEIEPKFECTIFQVPKQWTVACWLTEVISSALVSLDIAKSAKFSLDIFSSLMDALTSFYMKSDAPSFINQVIIKIISRLIVKMRMVLRKIDEIGEMSEDMKSKTHCQMLHIPSEFLEKITKTADAEVKNEDENPFNNSKKDALYPAFVQDYSELLMMLLIPVKSKQ
jgi:hypothetical protein